MSSYYVRHELLRHESVRKFTFRNIKLDGKFLLASQGFYVDNEIKFLICFSCNFIVPFTILTSKIYENHSNNVCAFLQGRDVSVGDRDWDPNYAFIALLGTSWFNNTDYFTRTLDKKIKEQIFQHCTLESPYLLIKKSRLKTFLGVLHAPIYIPSISDSNKCFDVETFFITMRSEERRMQTYKLKNHLFPLGEQLAEKLAKNGFIYTLLNTSIQCAFCRIIIGNVTLEVDINGTHLQISPKCKFALGDNVHNEISSKIYQPYPTSVSEIQCKICLNNEINVIYDCGHFIVCSSCSECLSLCPLCKRSLTGKRRLYIS